MAERSSKQKRQDHNVSAAAFRIGQEATGDTDDTTSEVMPQATGKNPNAVALGRLGGKKGGKARAAKLTPERRQEIARNAARARWGEKQVSHE